MSETLVSVGLDVGTTSTQLIVSELRVENKASPFAVPDMAITARHIRYQSPVIFTPLAGAQRVDGEKIRIWVLEQYRRAGLTREMVDTGAILITGETSRKENARAVSESLSDLAGDFVVATAGPDLESVLAAKGSGAVEFSRETGKTVLHMDIGGGTSNLALLRRGRIEKTGCLNVGGRLIKLEKGTVTYVSPVLVGLTDIQVGDRPSHAQLRILADMLTQALEMAAGLREATPLLTRLQTEEARENFHILEEVSLSFSGGVAACIQNAHDAAEFGDIGPILGQAIRESRLCRREYRIAPDPIRATVIGAGCHSARLSGSTVFYKNIRFPLKNLPVYRFGQAHPEEPAVLAVSKPIATYAQAAALAEALEPVAGMLLVCLESDAARALGQLLARKWGETMPILCIDGLRLPEESYLDVGEPIGPALPVVVKTLIWKEGCT